MKIYSFVEAGFKATKKFTEELFDEETIKDDEFVKLLFIETRKELKKIRNCKKYNSSHDNDIFAGVESCEELPFDIVDDMPCEKPEFIPNQTIKNDSRINEFAKPLTEMTNSLFIKENFNEMPKYVC